MLRDYHQPRTFTYLVICDLVVKSSDLIDRRTSMQPRYWKPKTKIIFHIPCDVDHHVHIYMSSVVISVTEARLNNSKPLSCEHIPPSVHKDIHLHEFRCDCSQD